MAMQYTYDIAISFAEEDRTTALSMVRLLEEKGYRIYFDPEKREETAGRELTTELVRLYQYESEFILVLLSKNYVRKHWTRIEYSAALARRICYPGSLLPVLLDGTLPGELIGLSDATGAILWKGDPAEVAKLFARKKNKTMKEEPDSGNMKVDIKNHYGDISMYKFLSGGNK